MPTTRRIPSEQWTAYFDGATQLLLADEVPKSATIEVLSPVLGDQLPTAAARLRGLAYDRQRDSFVVLMEDLDHFVLCPAEIWVIEEEGGVLSTLEVVCPDGSKQIVYFQRSGPPAAREPDYFDNSS
jgi:Family of unknown function (DUF5335)